MKSKICIFLLALWLAGCNDFLTESSQDEVKPSTVEDLEQILLGDAYLNDYNIYNITFLFTDDAQCNGLNNSSYEEVFEKDKWKFTWSDKMFTDEGGGYDADFWEIPYKGIWGCNIVLDNLDKVEGDNRLRTSIRGEALVLRSWYYLMLVNFFGQPYNQGDPTQSLGVPLKLNADVITDLFIRNTVAEVYAQIEADILEGNRLLKENSSNQSYFRVGHLAAKAMLSRMYLYMENWDKALAYADSVLAIKSDLFDMNDIEGWSNLKSSGTESVYSTILSNEIIWMRKYGKTTTQPLKIGTAPFTVSQSLRESLGSSYSVINAHAIKDIRGIVYIAWGTDYSALAGGDREHATFPYATVKDEESGKCQGIRTAELYLNRAEAEAHKYLNEGTETYRIKALADLNKLRRYRFNKSFTYEPIDIINAEDLISFCREERRRELCGETNHRWFDLRRYGEPELTHVFFKTKSEKENYTLKFNRYALPIPGKVLEINPKLQQNI